MVDLGHIFEAQFLLKYYERVGYNAGEQWNYDIYDINGKRFLYGDRTPDLKNNYSTEILKNAEGKLRSSLGRTRTIRRRLTS